MSKKRFRDPSTFITKHHEIWDRRLWEEYPEGVKLRQQPSLIIDVPRDIHDHIHEQLAPIPTPGYFAIAGMRKGYRPGKNHDESLTNLIGVVEALTHQNKIKVIEMKLLELVAEALELERQVLLQEARPAMLERF